MCEANERNQKALHQIQVMTGTWAIDLGLLRQILTGDQCTNHEGDNNVQPDNAATAA